MLALFINYVKKKLNIIHESLVKILFNSHFFSQVTKVSNRYRIKIISQSFPCFIPDDLE